MGRRGPAATPTNVLKARGSWRGKARDGYEPPTVEGDPERPSWLIGEAKKMWYALVEWLRGMGMLSITDVSSMVRYCQYWEQWVEATRVIRKEGPKEVTVDKRGQVITVDRCEIARQIKLGKELERIEKQFGLTPASRAALANIARGKTEEQKTSAEKFLADMA